MIKSFVQLIKHAKDFNKLNPTILKIIIATQGKIDAAKFLENSAVKESILKSNEIGKRWFKDGKLMIKKDTPKTKIRDKEEHIKLTKEIATRKGFNFLNINPENVGGFYDPTTHTVNLKFVPNDNLLPLLSNSFHEHLHGFGFGSSDVTKWKLDFLLDPNKTKTLSTAAKEYYLSDTEAPVHLAQFGYYNLGIKPGLPYIGDNAFKALLEEKGIGGAAYYMKRETPKELRRLWRAFNGTYFKNGGKILTYQ